MTADSSTQQKELYLVEKATKWTFVLLKTSEQQYKNVFDRTMDIPATTGEDLKKYYAEYISRYATQHGDLPTLPSLQTLRNELHEHAKEYVNQNIDRTEKVFNNPFQVGETVPYSDEEEIDNFIAQWITEAFRREGIEDDSRPVEIPSNQTVGSLGISGSASKQDLVAENGSDGRSQTVSDLPFSFNAGDATNPNTRLAYYYLKMRDYLRALRRFVGFVRFYQGTEKEHTFVSIDRDGKMELNHIYSTAGTTSTEQKDRLKRYMNVDDMQFFKKQKTN